MGLSNRRPRLVRRDRLSIRPHMVDGLRVLSRIDDRMHGAAIMSISRVLVAIYYDPEKRDLLNGDLSSRLKGLEWWITTEEKLPEGKLKVIDLTQLKD